MEVSFLITCQLPFAEPLNSGNGLVSFYINLVLEGVGITNAGTKAEINGGLQVWNLAAALSAALLVDKLGRRTLFIMSNTGMLISTY